MKIGLKIEFIKKSVARISLIFGVILLIFSSFSDQMVDLSFPVLFLSLGILFSRPNEKLYQEEKKTMLHHVFSPNLIIGSLILGTSLSCYLIMRGLQDIPWGTVYYFSPLYLSIIRLHPSIELVLGLIMSATLLAIILFDPLTETELTR